MIIREGAVVLQLDSCDSGCALRTECVSRSGCPSVVARKPEPSAHCGPRLTLGTAQHPARPATELGGGASPDGTAAFGERIPFATFMRSHGALSCLLRLTGEPIVGVAAALSIAEMPSAARDGGCRFGWRRSASAPLGRGRAEALAVRSGRSHIAPGRIDGIRPSVLQNRRRSA
jgi:hypothetical protein